MSDTDHDNVRRALDWFLSFLGTEEWTAQKVAIEAHLRGTFPIHPSGSVAEMQMLFSHAKADQFKAP